MGFRLGRFRQSLLPGWFALDPVAQVVELRLDLGDARQLGPELPDQLLNLLR